MKLCVLILYLLKSVFCQECSSVISLPDTELYDLVPMNLRNIKIFVIVLLKKLSNSMGNWNEKVQKVLDIDASSHVERCKDGIAFRKKGSSKMYCLAKEPDTRSKIQCLDNTKPKVKLAQMKYLFIEE